MKIFKLYYKNVIGYDFLHKFVFKETKHVPKLKEAVLTFCLKKYEIKRFLTLLVALKIISNVKFCGLIKSKFSITSSKMKRGEPIGSKIVLRKKKVSLFLLKLFSSIFSSKKKFKKNILSFKTRDILKFSELEQNYQYFKNLPVLNVNLIFTSGKKDLILFLLKSYKLK